MCWAELKNVLGSTLGLKKGNTSKENKSEALEKKKRKKRGALTREEKRRRKRGVLTREEEKEALNRKEMLKLVEAEGDSFAFIFSFKSSQKKL